MMRLPQLLSAASVALCLTAAPALADNGDIVIGAIYPMSGSAAQTGVDARFAIQTAVDIVNQAMDLDLPLAHDAGLPHLHHA